MKNGWRSVVYNRRGHGKSSLLPISGVLGNVKKIFPQHADMEDMKQVIDHIRAVYPRAPIILLGFSAGSNAVIKFLGEFADHPFIKAGISVCNGVDLVRLTTKFDKTANAIMTSQLRSLVKKKLHEIKKLQDAHGINIRWDKIMTTLNSREFEQYLMLPIYTQYNDIDSYLTSNSCVSVIKNVTTPVLFMTALDDPLIHPEIPAMVQQASLENPNMISLCTKQGGHLGWVSGWTGELWGMRVIEQFISSVLSI